MSNVLKRVIDAMCIVVGWVDAPLVASMRMRHIANAIGDEVTHIWVDMFHIDFDSKTAFVFSEETLAHLVKELQVFLD